MCGIVGFLEPALAPDGRPDALLGMLRSIGHRGPDGLGWFLDDGCGLGATRLAIIDIESGTQPMSDPSGRWWLAYNGEVYNYLELRAELEAAGRVFRTRSDTEVVLQAWLHWGPDCLPRFDGGFAFALYDRVERRLVLARDRYGKRPLYYLEQGGGLWFASEMKAFFQVPGFAFEQDPAQLASILATWTPLPDQSGFKDVRSLPTASWLQRTDGRSEIRAYEPLGFDSDLSVASEAEALELIRSRLRDSVALRLRSDVEVGVYLSGGIDSAIVALLAGEVTRHPLSTFSVTFEDAAYDESAEQQELAEFLGTRHQAQPIGHAELAAACPEAVFHAEVPAFRSAFIPMFLLSRRTREAGIKVVLSGEGADEAFLGYDLFKETLLRRQWNSLDESVRRERLGRLYPHLKHYGPQDLAALAGLYQQFSEERMPGLFSHELRFQNGRFSTRLLARDGRPDDPFAALAGLAAAEPGFAAMSDVRKAQWLEYRTLLAGYLLSTQGERMSLAHGVENRCPFLDPAVIEAASATNLRFDDGFEEKRLLRRAFADRLPASIVNKRKFPYRAPDAAAFAATRPDYLEALLSEAELGKLPFLDAGFARRLTAKVMTRPAAEISTKEDQTFLFLLSIALLNRFFVGREGERAALSTRVEPPQVRAVDLRGRPVGAAEAAYSSQGNLSSVT